MGESTPSSPKTPQPPQTPTSSTASTQSVRSSRKVPLPRYTSIDLENDLPEIFSTSLNPNIHDPDMSMFFSRTGPPFYGAHSKRGSPPPSYLSQRSRSQSTTIQKAAERRRRLLRAFAVAFACTFFVIPICILLVFYMIPALLAASPNAPHRG
ncbi:unnamed protein product [Caenorhabditis auriculariae]|uniref:Uncharacterized protein n=1 Tax=Caenorhabditis auriculariae TaxID=2777116 RepID=A0A8S1GWB8_9PELO|nr:unnamed protein product [Caenorhabditis auriculariae]